MKRIQRSIRLLTFVFGLFVSVYGPQAAEAATYYVAQSGSDGVSCSQARSSSTPRRTVNGGLSCLSSGDTLQVGPGTYAEGIISTSGSRIPNGSESAYTRIVGNGNVFLAPSKTSGEWNAGIYLGASGSYIEFDGIGTDGSNYDSLDWPGCCGLALSGNSRGSIHHIRVLNGEFKNNKCGSMGFSNASDVEVRGNYLHGDQCHAISHGIYVGDHTERITVDGNTVEAFTDWGVQLYASSGDGPRDSVIRNNIVINNGGDTFGGGGITVGGPNNVVDSNTVVGNYSGISVKYAGASNIQVTNNKLAENYFWYAIFVDPTATNTTVSNNQFYHNGIDAVYDTGSRSSISDNEVSSALANLSSSTVPPGLGQTSQTTETSQSSQTSESSESTGSSQSSDSTTTSSGGTAQDSTDSGKELDGPSGLASQCNGNGTVSLSWNPISGAVNYYVRVDYLGNDDLNSGEWYISPTVEHYLDQFSGTHFTGNITPGQQYRWWVHGANSWGIGGSSEGFFTCN